MGHRVAPRIVQVVRPLVDVVGPRLDGRVPPAAFPHARHAAAPAREDLFLGNLSRPLAHQKVDQIIDIRQSPAGPRFGRDLSVKAQRPDPLAGRGHVARIGIQALHKIAVVDMQGGRKLAVAAAQVHDEAPVDAAGGKDSRGFGRGGRDPAWQSQEHEGDGEQAYCRVFHHSALCRCVWAGWCSSEPLLLESTRSGGNCQMFAPEGPVDACAAATENVGKQILFMGKRSMVMNSVRRTSRHPGLFQGSLCYFRSFCCCRCRRWHCPGGGTGSALSHSLGAGRGCHCRLRPAGRWENNRPRAVLFQWAPPRCDRRPPRRAGRHPMDRAAGQGGNRTNALGRYPLAEPRSTAPRRLSRDCLRPERSNASIPRNGKRRSGACRFISSRCRCRRAEVVHQRGWLNATPKADPFPFLGDVHAGTPEICSNWSRNWSYAVPIGAYPHSRGRAVGAGGEALCGLRFHGLAAGRADGALSGHGLLLAAGRASGSSSPWPIPTPAAASRRLPTRRRATRSRDDSAWSIRRTCRRPKIPTPSCSKITSAATPGSFPRVPAMNDMGWMPGGTRLPHLPAASRAGLIVRICPRERFFEEPGTVEIGGWTTHRESAVTAAFRRGDTS